jgi:hypothetical protein
MAICYEFCNAGLSRMRRVRTTSKEYPMLKRRFRSTVTVALLTALCASPLGAQTRIQPPSNKYAPSDDVKLGREAAAEVERQLPLLRDEQVSTYVERLGDRLVEAIPPNLQHSEFRYSFKVVDVKEINAFALPGGPMYVNRGMLGAAHTEGEVAGVMAHELAHVALRHGTAQAAKAQKYQIGQVAGAILGAVIGGRAGAVVARGSELGIGISFLRFGREYEKQADLLGAQIMARAGYNPVDMANMFRTIEQQSGGGGPEFLSDHPNPGNRVEYITAEARSITVSDPVRDTVEFSRTQSHLRSLPPPRETRRASASQQRPIGTTGVEPPDSRYRTYTEGNLFRVSVPGNWQEVPAGNNAVWFAPEGAYGTADGGQTVFTHGVQFGVGESRTSDLQEATNDLIQSLAQGNPNLRQASRARRAAFADRNGMLLHLRNVSEATGQPEIISLRTALLDSRTLLFSIAVAPESEFNDYEPVFRRVERSVEVNER